MELQLLKCDDYEVEQTSLIMSSDSVGNSNKTPICAKTGGAGCTKCDCTSQSGGQKGKYENYNLNISANYHI